MSNLEKRRGGSLEASQVDNTFQKYAQIHLTIPSSIFTQAGLELNHSSVMKVVNEVLLPMPRFKGFSCDRRFWNDGKGNGRVLLTKISMGDILYLRLPDDFVLPPSLKQLPSKTPEDLAPRLDEL
jgi:hypothetical protein